MTLIQNALNTGLLHKWLIGGYLLIQLTFLSSSLFAGNVTAVDCTTCTACDGNATCTMEEAGMLTYRWTNFSGVEILLEETDVGFSVLDNLCPGIYYVSVAQGENSLANFSFNVAVNGFDPGENTTLFTCESSSEFALINSLEGNPMPGGEWQDNEGESVSPFFDPEFSDDETLIYTISAGECDVSSQITIIVNENADPGISTTYDICDHYDPFELIDVLNGQPEPNGAWFDPEGNEFSGTFVPGVDSSGTFIYMIDTVPGCGPVFSNVNMDVHHYPEPGEDAVLTMCADGGPIIMTEYLGGSPEGNGQWYDPTNSPTDSLLDPASDMPGIYKYVIQGTAPCPTRQALFEVDFEADISAGENTTLLVCEMDESFELIDVLNGSPDDNGYWTDELGTTITGAFNPQNFSSTEFIYTVEAVGCNPESATVNIDVEQMPEAGSGQTMALCESEPVLLPAEILSNEAWGNGVWILNDSILDNSQISFTLGTHYLKYVVSGMACPSDTADFVITVDQELPPLEDEVWNFCESEPVVNLNQYLEETSYETEFVNTFTGETWENYDPAVEANGQFWCIYQSANACPNDTILITIQTDQIAFEDSIISRQVCETVEVFNLNSVLNEENIGLGTWSGGQGGNLIEINIDAGNFEYYYFSANGEACATSIIQLNLQVVEQQSAGMDTIIDLCSSDPVVDLNSLVDIDENVIGTWLLGGEPLEDSLFDPSANESVSIFYEVESQAPCVSSLAQYTFNVFDEISFEAGEDLAVCADAPAVQIGMSSNGEYQYEWSASPLISDSFVSNPWLLFDLLEGNSYEEAIFVTVTNGACEIQDSIAVEVWPTPDIDVEGDLTVCHSEAYQLVVNGAESYLWTGDQSIENPYEDTLSGIALSNAHFSVIGTNQYGCSTQQDIEITVLDTPLFNVDITELFGCAPLITGLSYEMLQGEVESYYWTINNSFHSVSESNIIELTEPGNYEVSLHITGQNGCSSVASAEDPIQVYDIPTAEFIYSPEEITVENPRVEYLNLSEGASNFEWNFGSAGVSFDENPEVYYSENHPGFYETCLSASNEFGCLDTICKTIEIQGWYSVYVPNAFSPNSDGINEVFKPVMEGVDPGHYLIVIYDRWGEEVFRTEDPTQAWIGNYKGGNYYVSPGIYNWQMKVRNRFTGEEELLNGHITLLR